MKLRHKQRPQRESLVSIEARQRKERTQTQGWDRFRVITVGPGSLEGPDGLWEGKWLFSGDKLTGIVKVIKEDSIELPFGPRARGAYEGARRAAQGGPCAHYRVFIERPWEYAELGPQTILDPRELRMSEGYTVMGHQL